MTSPTLVLRGGRILREGPVTDVAVSGDRIVGIAHTGAPSTGGAPEVLDVSGLTVVPGLVDLHVHAVDGHWASRAGLPGLAAALAARGVTSFLATSVTGPHEDLLDLVRAASEPPLSGARCLGVHLEGPWISPERLGAQPSEHVRPPSVAELVELADAGPVRLVTVAPELPGAAELIAAACERGIVVSLGHSDASYAEAVDAVSRGARHVTHAFNAMPPLHHRAPGLAGAALDLPGLTVEAIADGVHLDPAVVRLLWRACGPGRVCLVSDCVEVDAPGLDVGAAVRVGDRLAGSVIGLARAVANCVQWGIPLGDALAMASSTPAGVLGRRASLAVGAPSDLVVLDEELNVRHTIVNGQVVFSA